MKKIVLLITLFLSCFLGNAIAQVAKTQVKITGVRSSKGNIILTVFKDEKSYESQQPLKKLVFDKKTFAKGSVTLNFEIESGTYGITMVDDENANGKIDKNFIGIPKEGFGFANFYMSGMSKPSFDDFKVVIKPAQNNVEIKVKYM